MYWIRMLRPCSMQCQPLTLCSGGAMAPAIVVTTKSFRASMPLPGAAMFCGESAVTLKGATAHSCCCMPVRCTKPSTPAAPLQKRASGFKASAMCTIATSRDGCRSKYHTYRAIGNYTAPTKRRASCEITVKSVALKRIVPCYLRSRRTCLRTCPSEDQPPCPPRAQLIDFVTQRGAKLAADLSTNNKPITQALPEPTSA